MKCGCVCGNFFLKRKLLFGEREKFRCDLDAFNICARCKCVEIKARVARARIMQQAKLRLRKKFGERIGEAKCITPDAGKMVLDRARVENKNLIHGLIF